MLWNSASGYPQTSALLKPHRMKQGDNMQRIVLMQMKLFQTCFTNMFLEIIYSKKYIDREIICWQGNRGTRDIGSLV